LLPPRFSEAETHDHYTLIYGIIDHPNGSRGQDVAIVSLMHLRKSVLQHNVTYATALAHLSHRNAFDLTLLNADGSPPRHTLEAVTNDTYGTTSSFRGCPLTCVRGGNVNLFIIDDSPWCVDIHCCLYRYRIRSEFLGRDASGESGGGQQVHLPDSVSGVIKSNVLCSPR
jgi:hypothetical protein